MKKNTIKNTVNKQKTEIYLESPTNGTFFITRTTDKKLNNVISDHKTNKSSVVSAYPPT